ncbi:MAG: iron-sulfur cluster-binding domain-containing protein [Anaerolineae bacterium]|jgi:ferredoxin-NADP reductase/ferredoxin
MKVNVRGHLWDLLAFRRLVPKRRKRIKKSAAQPLGLDPMNRLAGQLHPGEQHLVIVDVRDETATARTFRLAADPGAGNGALAYFRAGQYLSLKVQVDGVGTTRPYSISSAPYEALGDDGYYEVTIRRDPDGFLTPYLWDRWQVGTKIVSSGPCGTFYHEPLRDAGRIVGLAGGSGITPFRSMAREIVHGDLEVGLTLIYGSSDQDDILFYEELQALQAEAPDRVRVVHVLSCEEVSLEGCEQGFITAEIIDKYADVAGSSFFVCGPQAMYRFVADELARFNLPPRRVRREVWGATGDASGEPGFPRQVAGQTFRLVVRNGADGPLEVPARATEPVLVALERANLVPPSQCRSGECGFCRSRLLAGEVYVLPDGDGRRAADRQFGYIHPCASYPLSDLEVVVPRS